MGIGNKGATVSPFDFLFHLKLYLEYFDVLKGFGAIHILCFMNLIYIQYKLWRIDNFIHSTNSKRVNIFN